MSTRDDGKSARQIARGQTKRAGDRSARLARALMEIKDSTLKRMTLDDELREKIVDARRVTSHVARRRAERALAGELRRWDLPPIDAELARVQQNTGDVEELHLAERWRAALIEGSSDLERYPYDFDDELLRLIEAARKERDVGKPPGAGRALFRKVIDQIRGAKAAAAPASEAEDDDDAADADDE